MHICQYILFQVVIPAVSSVTSSKTWPEVVTQDVCGHTGSLKATLTVLSGKVKGQTLLPTSHDVQYAAEANFDKYVTLLLKVLSNH